MISLLKRLLSRVITAMETVHWPQEDSHDLGFGTYREYGKPTHYLDDEGIEWPPRRVSEERWST